MSQPSDLHEILKIGPRVTALPVVHGSGDFAWTVRHAMLAGNFDCLAVPLPGSFAQPLEQAILQLPMAGIVTQRETANFASPDDDGEPSASYVPVDPCQPVIAALRTAIGEHIPRRYVDLETANFQADTAVLPDAYALKKVPLPQFAAAILPFLTPPQHEQVRQRINYMAWTLRELSIDYENILFVCSVLHWPWVRAAFHDRQLQVDDHDLVDEARAWSVELQTLYFLLGELPYITGLYEQARAELGPDDNLSIDGVKRLLISARAHYKANFRGRAKKVTPFLLRQMLKYIRNLTLIDHRLTPDLTTIVTAAKQIVGDGYALEVLEEAKQYPFAGVSPFDSIRMGIDEAAFPDGDVLLMKNRLAGPPVTWSNIQLTPRPDEKDRQQWKQRWNPYSQCSWPPEDVLIENFRSAVFDRARQIMGADLAKTEKFTTSVKDGIDIRDTLRHWYEGDIYVKVLPPNNGNLDAAVMLFDSPADPRDYPWRTTWFAEHKDESTLAFFASDFHEQPVGPGICLANYGGAIFLYPPVAIPDIWTNPQFDFATTMEERLLAAACFYSDCRHVALVSKLPPGPAWRQIAKHYKKALVHVPLGQFSDSTVQQLRMVHVLNGKEVRSFAADFIRRA
ncbi:MAG: hypothetical protein ACR2NP_00505 [Pirellulaceae bacterium]